MLGLVERDTKKCYLEAVPRRDMPHLEPIIENTVLDHTVIHSDMWRAYNGLANLGHNWTHRRVNHHLHFVDPVTGVHTNTIEGLWANCKAKFRGMHGTQDHLFDGYLCEFMYVNYHFRQRGRSIFCQMLYDITQRYPV